MGFHYGVVVFSTDDDSTHEPHHTLHAIHYFVTEGWLLIFPTFFGLLWPLVPPPPTSAFDSWSRFHWCRGGGGHLSDIFLTGLFPHPVNTSIVRELNPPTFPLFLPGLWSSALVLSIHPSFSVSDSLHDTNAPAVGRLKHLLSIPVPTLVSSAPVCTRNWLEEGEKVKVAGFKGWCQLYWTCLCYRN